MVNITITGADVFDGERLLAWRPDVHVADGRIAAVGTRPVNFEPGRVIDCPGMTVMPGMTSAHFHAEMGYVKIATFFDQHVGMERPPGFLMLVAANSMKTALMSGYTGVVGAACSAQIDVQLKMAMDEGVIVGPRILPCSRGLDSPGHSMNDPARWWTKMPEEGSFRFCSGADEFRRAVRDEIRCGAEIVKIFATTGHGAEEPRNIKGLADDELRAVVEAAHQRNVKVRAHVCYRDDILQCIEYGVDVIDHGDEIDDECIAMMVERGTFLVPSMYLIRTLRDHSEFNLHEAYELHERPADTAFQQSQHFLRRAVAAGVKIVAGDDYGLESMPHALGEYSKELAFYVREVGIDPAEVLKWATRNGAELLGADAGAIAAGKLADLIVVNGRPTETIELLSDVDNIPLIMLGGVIVKDELERAHRHGEPQQRLAETVD